MRQLHKLKISRDQIFCRSAKTDLRSTTRTTLFVSLLRRIHRNFTRRDATRRMYDSNPTIISYI